MSALDTYRSYSVGEPGLFARLRSRMNAWREARLTRIELSRLSDRDLDDIGLCRGDIERVARGL